MEEDEPNYYEELNRIVDRAVAQGELRIDLVEALAFSEGLQTAYTAALIQRLLDLLEEKKILTQSDRTKLKASVKKTLDQQRKATAEKYQESPFAKGIAEAIKEPKTSLTFSTHIWKYVDLDQISEYKKAEKRD